MNAFVKAVKNTPVAARTENGMKAQKSTMSSVVDLFYNIGASRGKNIIPQFERALQENTDLAVRVAQWARDVRGGAGERQLFRDILVHLEQNHPEVIFHSQLIHKIAEIGRWDDLLVFQSAEGKKIAFGLIQNALAAGNGLCAKWMPRKGPIAVELRNFLGMTPKSYRKTLVNLTKVVETAMCAKEYSGIVYDHVPSVAMSRYMKAFSRNDADRFVAYRKSLEKGTAKINASAVYPYDIIKSIRAGGDPIVSSAQWDALPNYMNDTNVLPMVDVSGSMYCPAGNNPNVQCVDVAVSLGLYCADKNSGAFKDMFLTFSGTPEILTLKGKLHSKMKQMDTSSWAMNTNLNAAFELILSLAVKNAVPAEDMPKVLLILSDMQFDQCARFDDSAFQMIRRKYETAGYEVPSIVFWNLRATDNVPVSYNKKGVCLVSGFSPSIMKAVLAADLDSFSPENIVKDAVGIARYDWQGSNV